MSRALWLVVARILVFNFFHTVKDCKRPKTSNVQCVRVPYTVNCWPAPVAIMQFQFYHQRQAVDSGLPHTHTPIYTLVNLLFKSNILPIWIEWNREQAAAAGVHSAKSAKLKIAITILLSNIGTEIKYQKCTAHDIWFSSSTHSRFAHCFACKEMETEH